MSLALPIARKAQPAPLIPPYHLPVRAHRHKSSLPLVLGMGLVTLLIFLLIPQKGSDLDRLNIPANGKVVYSALPLEKGKRYKVIVGRSFNFRPGISADAVSITADAPYDTPRLNLEVAGAQKPPDEADRARHTYTYYVIGQGRRVPIRIVDQLPLVGLEGGYEDNSGYLTLAVEKASYLMNVDWQRSQAGASVAFRYRLDPPPKPGEEVNLRIFAPNGDVVYQADSLHPIPPDEGSPAALSTQTDGEFEWRCAGNMGAYAGRTLGCGIYKAEVSVSTEDGEFSCFPPNPRQTQLAVLMPPTSKEDLSGLHAAMIPLSDGNEAYPYTTGRAAFPVLGPVADLIVDSDSPLPFVCRSPGYNAAVKYLERSLNLLGSTCWEFTGEVPPLCDNDGVYGADVENAVQWLRENFSYPAWGEKAIIRKLDNLPPGPSRTPTKAELSFLAGSDTFRHIAELTMNFPECPVPLKLTDLDNLKAYDAGDPDHSLYHQFVDVGTAANREQRIFSILPSGQEAAKGQAYEFEDSWFIALMMAVGYQESGFIHQRSTGFVYRAGKGRGTATGIMQITADLINCNYSLTFYRGEGKDRQAVVVNQRDLSPNARYAVRNINYINMQIGAKFLKEMLNYPYQHYHRAFKSEFAAGGCLDATTIRGKIYRAKLAGAMYNAGPAAVKSIVEELYDDPATPDFNEGVAMLFGKDCGGDMEIFIKQFRDDLKLFMLGQFHFPLEKTAEGRAKLDRLFKWLGPYWQPKYGCSWEEAALMKLEKEVIPYMRNLAANMPKFYERGEAMFKSAEFTGLGAPKEIVQQELQTDQTSIDTTAPPPTDTTVPTVPGEVLPPTEGTTAPGTTPTTGEKSAVVEKKTPGITEEKGKPPK
jgi:hypothetical protein